MPQKVLLLVAVGSPPPQLLKDVEEPIVQQLGVAISPSRLTLQRPSYAFNKDRGQYHSNAIMRRLVPLLERSHSFVLGLTDVDLFVPDSPFVFGEADRESRSAVVSTARLVPSGEPGAGQLRRRLQVEALHQAGHLVGLSYCEDPRCAMFAAQTPQDTDKKQATLCNLCRNELQKLLR
jgi:archaemetzincin